MGGGEAVLVLQVVALAEQVGEVVLQLVPVGQAVHQPDVHRLPGGEGAPVDQRPHVLGAAVAIPGDRVDQGAVEVVQQGLEGLARRGGRAGAGLLLGGRLVLAAAGHLGLDSHEVHRALEVLQLQGEADQVELGGGVHEDPVGGGGQQVGAGPGPGAQPDHHGPALLGEALEDGSELLHLGHRHREAADGQHQSADVAVGRRPLEPADEVQPGLLGHRQEALRGLVGPPDVQVDQHDVLLDLEQAIVVVLDADTRDPGLARVGGPGAQPRAAQEDLQPAPDGGRFVQRDVLGDLRPQDQPLDGAGAQRDDHVPAPWGQLAGGVLRLQVQAQLQEALPGAVEDAAPPGGEQAVLGGGVADVADGAPEAQRRDRPPGEPQVPGEEAVPAVTGKVPGRADPHEHVLRQRERQRAGHAPPGRRLPDAVVAHAHGEALGERRGQRDVLGVRVEVLAGVQRQRGVGVEAEVGRVDPRGVGAVLAGHRGGRRLEAVHAGGLGGDEGQERVEQDEHGASLRWRIIAGRGGRGATRPGRMVSSPAGGGCLRQGFRRIALLLAVAFATGGAPGPVARNDAAEADPDQPPRDGAAQASPATAEPTPAAVRERIEAIARPFLDDALFHVADSGLHIVDLGTGETLFDQQAGRPLVPASTMKLLTAWVALKELGPSWRFTTVMGTDGELSPDGTLAGDLVVVGGGDPSLVVEKLWKMVVDLKAEGVRRIRGDLVLDDGYFDHRWLIEGWRKPADLARGPAYFAPLGALSGNFNTAASVVGPGAGVGEPARVELETPAPGIVEVEAQADTVERGRRRLQVERIVEGERVRFVVKGRVPLEADPVRIYRTVPRPTPYFGAVLRYLLEHEGVELKGRLVVRAAPDDLRPLVTHRSEPLATLLATMNKHSSNFIAEQVLKAVSAELDGPPGSTAGGLAHVRRHLEAIGVDLDEVHLVNGSGLSRSIRLAPEHLTAVLRDAALDPSISPEFVASLAIGGRDGTLWSRFDAPDEVDRLRGKTGTLDGVHGLAGLLELPWAGPVAFAWLVNGPPGIVADARRLQDAFLGAVVDGEPPLASTEP